MAGRTRRIQIELNIPASAIFGMAGKGLETDPEGPWLQVNAGAGLTFYDDRLCPNLHPAGDLLIKDEMIAVNLLPLANKLAGHGLKVTDRASIAVKLVPGGGLVLADDGMAMDIGVVAGVVAGRVGGAYAPSLAGDGLVAQDGKLAVDIGGVAPELAGDGLVAQDGKLAVEWDSTSVSESFFRVVTGTNLTLEAKTLILYRELTTFAIQKNHRGFVVGIMPVNVENETDLVTLPDVYGYGFATADQATAPNTETLPNFYE